MLSASLLIPPPLRPSNGKKRIAVRDCTCFVRRGGIRPPRAGGVCPDPAGILRRSFPTWVAAVFASGEPIRRAPGHARKRAACRRAPARGAARGARRPGPGGGAGGGGGRAD